ncbi:MAG: hypothetical protein IH940_00200 [Acidobacteria bacterium]|nr:hypothetical protein [Acidobacteriota bacterium]
MTDLVVTVVVTLTLCVPLVWSVVALLDAAGHPAWTWAFAGKSQVFWIALILAGVLSVIGGLIIATIYMRRVRPVLIDAEYGILRD